MADGLQQIMNIGLVALGVFVIWLVFMQMRCVFRDQCKDLCKGIQGCKSQCWGKQCRVTGPLGRVMYVDPEQAGKAKQRVAEFVHKARVGAASGAGARGRQEADLSTRGDVVDLGPSGYDGMGAGDAVIVGADF